MNTEDYRNAELDRAYLPSENDMPALAFWIPPLSLLAAAGLIMLAVWWVAPSLGDFVQAWKHMEGMK